MNFKTFIFYTSIGSDFIVLIFFSFPTATSGSAACLRFDAFFFFGDSSASMFVSTLISSTRASSSTFASGAVFTSSFSSNFMTLFCERDIYSQIKFVKNIL